MIGKPTQATVSRVRNSGKGQTQRVMTGKGTNTKDYDRDRDITKGYDRERGIHERI